MSSLSPTADVWSRFTLLLSRDVLARRYKEQHGGELKTGQANEIIAHLIQAREYFESAASAGVFVRPLLQYYGVLAFSRAIVLFRTPGLREAALKPSHGLGATLAGTSALSELTITVSGGTFRELLSATGNVERFGVAYMPTAESPSTFSLGKPATPFQHSLRAPAVETQFQLRDFLGRMPELAEILEESLAQPTRCYPCLLQVWSADSHTRISMHARRFGLPDPEQVRSALFRGVTSRGWSAHNGGLELEVTHTNLQELGDALPRIVDHGSIGSCIVEPYADGWSLSSLASLFVGSYVLSTFVRYHPTRWAALASGTRGDALLPGLLKLRDLIQSEFAALAIREFEAPAAYTVVLGLRGSRAEQE